MNCTDLKTQVSSFIEEMSDLIIGLSQKIHSDPELSFQEYNAVKSICERMKNAGFEIEENIGGLKTTSRAIHAAQSTGPTIAFIAEIVVKGSSTKLKISEAWRSLGVNLVGLSKMRLRPKIRKF